MSRHFFQLRRAFIHSCCLTATPFPKFRKACFCLHHVSDVSVCQARSYISEMRKSAFESNILRLLRNEIEYEHERSPPKQHVAKFDGYTIDERPREQWISLYGKFGESEEIKIEATMFDGPPLVKTRIGEEVPLHITFIVTISKPMRTDVLEFVCSGWPDSVEIQRAFVHPREQVSPHLYAGPEFRDLDDELQDGLYEFLECRGIDEDLANFLHDYMRNKDKTEFIRWMGTVKSFIEKKNHL